MRRFLLLLLCISASFLSQAKHISGGEMIYEYLREGTSPGTKVYRVTLRLFRDEACDQCADMPASVSIGIFDNSTGQQVGNYRMISLNRTESVAIDPFPPCIQNPPSIVYRMGFYIAEVTLQNNTGGYTLAYQTCCRIDNINNIPNQTGATYTTRIPAATNFATDRSPQFRTNLSVICFNKPFTFNFSATDPDGDSLVYSFCGGYNGGAATDASFSTPAPPPYGQMSYINGFSGGSPLGPNVTINSSTGIISGIAPNTGRYVLSVCVRSYRNGNYISEHRKDLIITVHSCDFAGAQLNPVYTTCDGFTMSFSNLNTSPQNESYYWTFGDPASGANNISTLENPSHTYSDTGTYVLKVVVNRGQPCSDSTTALVRVYPGWIPKFSAPLEQCKNTPVQFRDETFARYGTVNSWKWDFGDASTLADTSRLQHPVYTYPQAGTYTVKLIVGSDKGCTGTFQQDISIVDKAPISFSNDTLICSIDTLQLNTTSAVGGSITWTPEYNISNTNSFTPLVSPDITTTYTFSFTDIYGCTARDSIKVNVVDSVTMYLPADTSICKTDEVILPLQTDALYFTWSPATGLSDPSIKNPVTTPLSDFTYTVVGSIGKCVKQRSIRIKVVPYPVAQASNDTSICFKTNAQLQANGGSIYEWSPPIYLNDRNIPNPLATGVSSDVRYVVSVRDTLGCPKPAYDTVLVKMIRVIADAGPYDTAVVTGQPLQLNATGGTENSTYTWSPSTWLDNAFTPSPVSFAEDNIKYIVDIVTPEGCRGSDTIRVLLFKTAPDIFVPTGFTPNGDGQNEDFKPKAVGMKSIDVFNVYNRWGQLIYSSTNQVRGWDGSFRGNQQQSGTYVWYAEGVDYTGKRLSKKGTVVLIR